MRSSQHPAGLDRNFCREASSKRVGCGTEKLNITLACLIGKALIFRCWRLFNFPARYIRYDVTRNGGQHALVVYQGFAFASANSFKVWPCSGRSTLVNARACAVCASFGFVSKNRMITRAEGLTPQGFFAKLKIIFKKPLVICACNRFIIVDTLFTLGLTTVKRSLIHAQTRSIHASRTITPK